VPEDPHRIRTIEELEQALGAPKFSFEPDRYRSLDRFSIEYIARCPFLVLTTASGTGLQDVSPKGDAPGFVQVENAKTLVIPDRRGNRLAFGHRNILENPRVGILFMVPRTPETLRVGGRAEITADPDLLERLSARGRPAELAIRVHIDECFFHCAKAFLRSGLWNPEAWDDARRVSLGRWMAHRLESGDEMAQAIDALAEESYRTEL